MAIMQLGASTTGVNATCGGISHPTSASAERSFGTLSRAKDSEGNVVAVLMGKESIALSVSGYSTDAAGPALGGEISVAGAAGKVTSVTIERSNEDFSRFSAEGRGLPA
jgi:hypothetical protein